MLWREGLRSDPRLSALLITFTACNTPLYPPFSEWTIFLSFLEIPFLFSADPELPRDFDFNERLTRRPSETRRHCRVRCSKFSTIVCIQAPFRSLIRAPPTLWSLPGKDGIQSSERDSGSLEEGGSRNGWQVSVTISTSPGFKVLIPSSVQA